MKKNIIRFEDIPLSAQDLRGKTIVFTGGTNGMGRIALERLAKMGAEVMVLGRNLPKTQALVAEINGALGREATHAIPCDLASQRSIRAGAKIVLERCPRIDILINCAGANFAERSLSEDNIEISWAVNHLGGFLLTHLLLDRLKASQPARIIHLSSATEKYGHIHLGDIHLEKRWAVMRAYAQAKLAMNMCTRRLAKDLEGTQITVNALNPGWINTSLAAGSTITGWRRHVGGFLTKIFASPVEVGADRIITAAIAPQYDGISGAFIYEDHIRQPNAEALDDNLVEQVWQLSHAQVSLEPASMVVGGV